MDAVDRAGLCKITAKAQDFSHMKLVDAVDRAGLCKITAKAQDSSRMKLVDAVDRGGLCKITAENENMFLIAVRVFRNNTSENLLRKIDTNEMAGTLISDLELISHFNSVVADSKEIQINLLENMLGLYPRV